jgi:MoxR-like ATPase
VLDAEEILRIQAIVPHVPAGDHVHRLALDLVRRTRPDDPAAPQHVRQWLTWGAGPRASQSLVHAAKARALLHGRLHATLQDIEVLAAPVLAHRLVTNFNAEAEGVTAEGVVERLLGELLAEARREPR